MYHIHSLLGEQNEQEQMMQTGRLQQQQNLICSMKVAR